MELMQIHESIIKVMSEIGSIAKNKKNKQQDFMYRGVDDVMNALQPILQKYGVFITPEVLEQKREERTTKTGTNLIYSICTIKYTFYASDGSSVTAVVIGEGMDSGDKATNKAMSIAFKYACFQVFCIPTEEMKDPDSESYEVAPKAQVNAMSLACHQCGEMFKPFDFKGQHYTAEDAYNLAVKNYNGLCRNCRPKKQKPSDV